MPDNIVINQKNGKTLYGHDIFQGEHRPLGLGHSIRMLVFVVTVFLAGCATGPGTMKGMVKTPAPTEGTQTMVSAATVPIVLDSDRILIEVDFIRPDGGTRKALAWVNMGMSPPVLKKHLYRELAVDQGYPLAMRIGGISINVDSSAVVASPDGGDAEPQFWPHFFSHNVEAVLQAGVLQNFQLVLDYSNRTLTLAQAGTLKPDGIAVPCRLNENTGLVTVDASVDGQFYPVVIDAGSGYSWFRGNTVAAWLRKHPEWECAKGAVGSSNSNMMDYDFEKSGTVLRVPGLTLGILHLENVGILGTGPILGSLGDRLFGDLFWDSWQKNAPEPVVGWIGANVLKQYRLTIDYPNHVSYWLKCSEPDTHELDQIGITLVYRSGDYFVGGIVQKNGKNTADGVAKGDKLIQIDGRTTRGLPKEEVLAALHGIPGDHRILVVERQGTRIEVPLPVIAF